jgi:FlaA1/EpsC-like NDP-sugar epimerase
MVVRGYPRLTGLSSGLTNALTITGISAVTYSVALLVHTGSAPSNSLASVALLVGLRVLFVGVLGPRRSVWRVRRPGEMLQFVMWIGAASAVFLWTRWSAGAASSVAIVLLEFALAALLWVAVYLLVSHVRQRRRSRFDGNVSRVLIVGAGEAGELLAQDIQRRQEPGLRVVGFVDDDLRKQRDLPAGIPVLGPCGALPRLIRQHSIDRVVVAIPSAPPEVVRRVADKCRELDQPLDLLAPPVSSAGSVRLEQVRQLTVEDLLARDPVFLELPGLKDDVHGHCILITGAGGSIGSELARQIAAHGPGELVLLDQAETDLFHVDQELRRRHPDLHAIPVVGDILDRGHLNRLIAKQRPDRIFHAAAYKHVPLMESNPCEAVRNNVVGTWTVIDVAGAHGVEKLVLVSSDKAVNPSSVMGATKRIAELIMLACTAEYPDTAFTAVRFGNVLGSQGSVLPVFERQLAEQRPLTVTHPEVTRYFMTICEAVQLILQASLLEEAFGRIVMLDMGQPVRILDLATGVLELAGSVGDPRDNIEFIGLRPGEKLHEELVAPDERVVPTSVTRVKTVISDSVAGLDLLPERVHWWFGALAEGRGDEVLAEIWDICGRSVVSAPSTNPVQSARRA